MLREGIDYSSKLTGKIFWTNGGCTILIFFLALTNVSHGPLPGSHLFKSKLLVLVALPHDISGPNLHCIHYCSFSFCNSSGSWVKNFLINTFLLLFKVALRWGGVVLEGQGTGRITTHNVLPELAWSVPEHRHWCAKWNSANINYITRISAFHTVEAFVWSWPCWMWFNSIVQ